VVKREGRTRHQPETKMLTLIERKDNISIIL